MAQWIFWGVGILLVLGAVVLLGMPPVVQLPYKVVVTEIYPIGDDEVVWIKNAGDEAVDLSGWRLHGGPYFEFTFPTGCILAAGAKLAIHSGPGSEIHKSFLKDDPVCRPNGDLLWTLQYVWCDLNGDTAILYDAEGHQVDKYDYGAGWHESPFVPCSRGGVPEEPLIPLP